MPESYPRLLDTSGVEYWDVRQSTTGTTNITVWNKHLKDFISTTKQGCSVRVKYKGAMAFAHADTTDVRAVARQALRLAKAFARQKPLKLRIAAQKPLKGQRKSRFLQDPGKVPLEDKKQLLMDLAKQAAHPRLHSLQLVYADIKRQQTFQNSEGSDVLQELVHTYMGASVVMKGKTLESYDLRRGEMAGFELTHALPPLLDEAILTGALLLKAKTIKGGAMPVVCDGALTDVFVHEAVGHAAEADLVLQQDSCLAGRIGEHLAPEEVTLYDSAIEPTGWGSYFVDDEGVPAQKTTIIDKGVLASFLHNRETASLLNAQPTGNGRAQDVHSYPLVRMSNTYLEPGDTGEEELYEGIKQGVFLKGSRGGEVNTAQGSFLFNAQYGYVIKNGRLSEPVKLVSLGGNTLDILRNIQGIGKTPDRGFPGFCGKNGQSVQVEGVNPRIRINKAVVGGK